jgi:hypothetical protein
MFAYQDIHQERADVLAAYQQHPTTVVLTDFFCGFLSGLIFYFGSGWLTGQKQRKIKHAGEDKFYDEVARELQEKSIVAGLWTKAFAEMNGDDAKARALYIKYRVAQLADARREQPGPKTEENRLIDELLAKQRQEKRARKIKIFLAVAILGVIFVIIAVQTAADSRSVFDRQKKLAEKGDADAQETLGDFYYVGDVGEGGAQDFAEAVKWYRKSADQNNLIAQYNLGMCYEFGFGVAKDENEAVNWYRKAAEQGYFKAQEELGYDYDNGMGVAKDEVESYKWSSLAASQDDNFAKTNLATAESQMTPEQIAEGQRLSREFVPNNSSR